MEFESIARNSSYQLHPPMSFRMMANICKIAFIFLSIWQLSIGHALAQGALSEAANLYDKNRPASGEQGSVRDFTASRNCLYVSWVDLDGDHWLDVWSLSNGQAFVEAHPFGNLNDDQGALLPIAHLKSPRDLAVVNGRLVFWSLNELWEGDLRDNCSLSAFRSTKLSDARNDIMNRFSSSGSYGVTQRNFLTDQEFNTLLGQGVPFSELQKELTGKALINFQSEGSPFIIGSTRARGAQTLSVGNGTIGKIDSHPAILELSDDLTQLTVREYTPNRSDHINKMWEGPLGILFNLNNGSKTLNQLIDEILSDDLISSHGASVIAKVFQSQGFSLNKTVADLLQPRFKKTAKIDSVLKAYKLTKSTTVKAAVKKIVDKQLEGLALDSVASAALAERFSKSFLGTANLPISDLANQIATSLDTKLSSEGLQSYVVNTILRPLIDSPEALSVKLAPFLDKVVNNPAANTIDNALAAFQVALTAAGGINGPGCFAIPGSSREFVDLLFVKSGPKLNPDGLALFELLKLANFYLDGNDFPALVTDIEAKTKALHQALGLDATTELFRALNLPADITKSYSLLLEKYFEQAGVKAQLSETLTAEILAKLNKKGIKANTKLSVVLSQIQKLSRKSSITIADLQKWMKSKGLGVTLSSLATDIGKRFKLLPSIETQLSSVKLRKQMEALTEHIFGGISFDLSLRQAAVTFINSKINPRLMGDFVSQMLGKMLSNMSGGIGLPSVLGKATLAARGDCIATWRLTIDAAAGAAALLGLSQTAIAFETAEGWLSVGVDTGISYFLDGMIRNFLTEIFQSAGGQYQGWHLRLSPSNTVINLVAAAGRSGRLVNVFTHKNQVIAVLREMGASFPDLGGSKLITVVRLSPSGATAPVRLDFDGWQTVGAVLQTGDFLFFSGQRDGGPTRSILAVDLSKSPPSQHILEGNNLPGALSSPFKVLHIMDSTQLVVGAEVGGISILNLP